jgi:hypothetical protein
MIAKTRESAANKRDSLQFCKATAAAKAEAASDARCRGHTPPAAGRRAVQHAWNKGVYAQSMAAHIVSKSREGKHMEQIHRCVATLHIVQTIVRLLYFVCYKSSFCMAETAHVHVSYITNAQNTAASAAAAAALPRLHYSQTRPTKDPHQVALLPCCSKQYRWQEQGSKAHGADTEMHYTMLKGFCRKAKPDSCACLVHRKRTTHSCCYCCSCYFAKDRTSR